MIAKQLDRIEYEIVYSYEPNAVLQKIKVLEKLADISTKINDEVDMACVLGDKNG